MINETSDRQRDFSANIFSMVSNAKPHLSIDSRIEAIMALPLNYYLKEGQHVMRMSISLLSNEKIIETQKLLQELGIKSEVEYNDKWSKLKIDDDTIKFNELQKLYFQDLIKQGHMVFSNKNGLSNSIDSIRINFEDLLPHGPQATKAVCYSIGRVNATLNQPILDWDLTTSGAFPGSDKVAKINNPILAYEMETIVLKSNASLKPREYSAF